MLFIAKIVTIIISIYLIVLYNNIDCNQILRADVFPKLLYLVPVDSKISYTINEVDAFTSKIKNGWLFNSDKEISVRFFLQVKEKINSLDEISPSFVFFTTDNNECILNDLNDKIFDLKFNSNRSKFSNTLLVAEANITLKYNSSKYCSCVYFEKKSNNDSSPNKIEKNSLSKKFVHQGDKNVWTQIITTRELLPFYVVIIFYFFLLLFSALFSGLNLGLMSLDLTELQHLKHIGSAKEKSYALKIYPLRKKGNLLLCTILIGNVLVNSLSTLILGNYLEGVLAAAGSTLLIVIFGEIIPQAACSRHGLAVGAYTRHFTYIMMGLTYVISYPLSLILDVLLGKEIAAVYSREKARELILRATNDKQNGGMKENQYKLISGALDFKNKTVRETMVEIKDVFSLDINATLDFDTFKIILYHGYSRIPVYEFTRENLVGMILIQDLLLNDPADKVPLRAVIEYYKHTALKCKLEDSLSEMFDVFRKGSSHMAFVYANSFNLNKQQQEEEAVGIITFEDLIEELVQSEIMDESDTKRKRRRKRANLSLSTENLNMFVTDDKTNRPIISTQVRNALFYFLASSVRPFTAQFICPKILETFLKKPEFTIEKRNLVESGNESDHYLYKYGLPCDYFIIILDGKATLQIGRKNELERIEINAGIFSYYGVDALLYEHETDPFKSLIDNERKQYEPDFSLKVNNYCVYLKISRPDWKSAVRKSLLEKTYYITDYIINK